MFQQRPMPPMNTRGYFPPQNQFPMGRQGIPGPNMGRGPHFGASMTQRGAGGGGLKGILSRILPGSQGAVSNPQGFIGGANAVSNATRARASGGIQGLMNPSNISGMLGNVQKVLGMAQQVTPMVQQYGPLVKNLPAMIKIYRELSSSDDSNSTSDETESVSTEESVEASQQLNTQSSKKHSKKPKVKDDIQENDEPTTTRKKRKPSPKSSQPKMYI
ncbi:VrrA/YqfQ family protein [Metabacillus schmidteae]|uniref:VrrA/YqfQ family protein n=1 Tax=Metabacillus schmidteae TaxID=2730405 RepID=UPI00158EC910|nr:VrrA/YqfQ family protein [Metabacillus schmidteae]